MVPQVLILAAKEMDTPSTGMRNLWDIGSSQGFFSLGISEGLFRYY